MKKSKLIAIFLVILAMSLIVFVSAQDNITEEENLTTNNTLLDDSTEIIDQQQISTGPTIIGGIKLSLDSNKYAPGTNIKGTLNTEFIETVSPNEPIKITLNGETYKYKLKDILDKQEYSIVYKSVEFNVTNPETAKEVSFTSKGSEFVGVQIPRYAEVESASFEITGSESAGSNPSGITIDIGNEGNKDWFYLGGFTDYKSEKISSTDLDEESEGSGFIQDNETYYCELINIPLTKNIKVSAEYNKVGSEGDIHAVILSVPIVSETPEYLGGSDTCDLPESSGACEIELPYTTEGLHLVCLYSEGPYTPGESIYSLPVDTTEETSTGFTCPFGVGGICDGTGFSDFFIYIETADYDNTLSGAVELAKWETFTQAILTGLKYYVGSEPYNGLCKNTICNIPLNITSESAGKITVSNLAIKYLHNSVHLETSTFYDLEQPQSNIANIESQVLDEGASIDLNLESFELNIDNLGEYTIEIEFMGDTASDTFNIVNADEIFDAKTLIAAAITRYKSFLNEASDEYQVLSMLDKTQKIENIIEQLESLRNQIGFTEEKVLLTQVEDLLFSEPWKIRFSQTFSDQIVAEPSEIPLSFGDQSEIYFMQESVKITGTRKAVEVITFNDQRSVYSFINKEVKAQEKIMDATLYELAPLSFSELLFTTRPTTSSGNIGEFDIDLNEGEKINLHFLTTKNVKLDDFKTVIVLPIVEDTIEPNNICGNDICETPYEDKNSCPTDCKKKFPWGITIFILIITIGITIMIIFKDKIFKKKETKISKEKPIAVSRPYKPVSKPEVKKPLFKK